MQSPAPLESADSRPALDQKLLPLRLPLQSAPEQIAAALATVLEPAGLRWRDSRLVEADEAARQPWQSHRGQTAADRAIARAAGPNRDRASNPHSAPPDYQRPALSFSADRSGCAAFWTIHPLIHRLV